MSRRSGLRNVTKLRRKLRRMPDQIEKHVRPALVVVATATAVDAASIVRKNYGDLAASIEPNFSRDGLSALVGPGAKGVKAERRVGRARARGKQLNLSGANQDLLFQAHKGAWIEFGTKGSPSKGIAPHPAYPFMAPAWDMNRSFGIALVRDAIDAALASITKG
ncbi:hypothetical protein [Nisaea sp.]|uniref:hypothetical protein n=1 Tax=Nisaea sp. TaxID=2024842 RepID=UPI003297ADED